MRMNEMEQTGIIPLSRRDIIAVLLGLVLVGCVTEAAAGPIAVVTNDGAKITLYDDPCELNEVSNLPQKAVWQEKGKTYAGCWSLHPAGFVVTFFKEDRTVAIIPARVFEKVTGV